jgi:hypothetical protein
MMLAGGKMVRLDVGLQGFVFSICNAFTYACIFVIINYGITA